MSQLLQQPEPKNNDIVADGENISVSDIPSLTPSETEKIIEAILFAAGYPVTYEKLAETLNIAVNSVKAAVESVAEKYSDLGIQIVLFEKTVQMCTREGHENYIKQALGIKKGNNLSNSSLETLAIIAYHQPVTRAYIEEIRGVDSSYAVSSLLDKNLIERKGRLDVPGRPSLYGTTNDFLRVFGLSSIDELPSVDIFGSNLD